MLRLVGYIALTTTLIYISSVAWSLVLAADDVRACGERVTVHHPEPGIVVTSIRQRCVLAT